MAKSSIKEGDLIRIVATPPKDRDEGPAFVEKMARSCGKVLRVECPVDSHGMVRAGGWSWIPKWYTRVGSGSGNRRALLLVGRPR